MSGVWSERGNIGSHLSHERIYKHTVTESFEGKRGFAPLKDSKYI